MIEIMTTLIPAPAELRGAGSKEIKSARQVGRGAVDGSLCSHSLERLTTHV